jgi:hypothetical protein
VKYVSTSECTSIKLGMIGTVTNPETGQIWTGEYYVEGMRVIHSEPAKEVLTLASVRRLITKTPGYLIAKDPALQSYTPDRLEVKLDQPYTRCTDLNVSWFTPADPPRFFVQPETVAAAVTS